MLMHVGFLFNIHKLCYTVFFARIVIYEQIQNKYKCQRSEIISVFEIREKKND